MNIKVSNVTGDKWHDLEIALSEKISDQDELRVEGETFELLQEGENVATGEWISSDTVTVDK